MWTPPPRAKHPPLFLMKLKAMPEDQQRALKGWYWYDFANQAFALTILAAVLPGLHGGPLDAEFGGGRFHPRPSRMGRTTPWSLPPQAWWWHWSVPLWAFSPIACRSRNACLVGSPWSASASPSDGHLPILRWGCRLEDAHGQRAFANFGFAAGNVFYYVLMPYLARRRRWTMSPRGGTSTDTSGASSS